MSARKPTYSIALGATTLSSDTLGPLVALELEYAKNAAIDRAVLALGPLPGGPPAVGDPATIELGWDGETTLVFTGGVDAVDHSIGGFEVTCAGTPARLARARGDRTFVRQTAGDVVAALARDAAVDVDTTEDGIQLPVYLADASRSALGHCLELARRCGFDLYTTPEGKLVFAGFARSTADETFRYGVSVVAASVQRTPVPAGASVLPESPASGQGDDTASWLVKDPSTYRGDAGTPPTAVAGDPVLRTKEAADTAAQARLGFAQREAVSGTLDVVGAPDVELGHAVALEAAPDDSLNDLYQVLAIRHRLDRRGGFRTRLAIGGMPS